MTEAKGAWWRQATLGLKLVGASWGSRLSGSSDRFDARSRPPPVSEWPSTIGRGRGGGVRANSIPPNQNQAGGSLSARPESLHVDRTTEINPEFSRANSGFAESGEKFIQRDLDLDRTTQIRTFSVGCRCNDRLDPAATHHDGAETGGYPPRGLVCQWVAEKHLPSARRAGN